MTLEGDPLARETASKTDQRQFSLGPITPLQLPGLRQPSLQRSISLADPNRNHGLLTCERCARPNPPWRCDADGVVPRLLRRGGRLVLRDFHPISTKLVSFKGRRHKLDGDYFDPSLYVTPVAHAKFGDEQGGAAAAAVPVVSHRRWTLGEVVTAVAAGGLTVFALDEENGTKAADRGIPKIYTLVADKL